jgi:hypothetical protein
MQKAKTLETKYRGLERENLELKMQVKSLLSQRALFLKQAGPNSKVAQMAKMQMDRKKAEQSVAQMKILGQEVAKKQNTVKESQSDMKSAMALMQKKDAEISSTLQMMKMLGIDPKDPSSVNAEDATQVKLLGMYKEQVTAKTAAKAQMQTHYATMLKAAEDLNKKNTLLKKATNAKTEAVKSFKATQAQAQQAAAKQKKQKKQKKKPSSDSDSDSDDSSGSEESGSGSGSDDSGSDDSGSDEAEDEGEKGEEECTIM